MTTNPLILSVPQRRRRDILIGLGAVMARPILGGSAHAAEPDFPNRPLTLIVPWTPGGSSDRVLRALAKAAEKHLKQPIVIQNRPGVGGTLGPVNMAATAAPDGYTVSQVLLSLFRQPHINEVTYDPLTDFTYIIGLWGYSTGILVRDDAPWRNWSEFVEYARANPGKVTYATTGVGTSLHITMERIGKAAGIQWVNVPYKGSSEATTALMGGQVMLQPDSIGSSPMLDSGRARVLVSWSGQRSERWPQVPTLRESGLDIVAIAPFGLAGPAGMDAERVRILHDAFKAALSDPECAKVAESSGMELAYQDSEGLSRWATDSFREEGEILRELGLARKT